MLFNSYVFIFAFLPVVLLGFYGLKTAGNNNLSIIWLVLASVFFYAYFEPKYVFIIAASIVCNFYCGKILSKYSNRKLTLILGITFNVLLLVYYKYAGLLTVTVNDYFFPVSIIQVALPIAISFFTFQQIAYLVDCYRGESENYSFSHYLLFVTFFPQLIAGPIVHHKEMLPQFGQTKHALDWQNIAVGLSIFIFGLFKKVVLADNIAQYSSPVFNAAEIGQEITPWDAWIATLAYTLQLYFDFSGYSDMAIGIARMFGIKLPINFNSPLKSKSISEFWRRWHITLSRFLRDYLYITFGGNRKGRVRQYTNLLLTMLIGGIWHGAGWNFLLWGGLHGIMLVINHLFKTFVNVKIPALISIAITFICVAVVFVPFRASTFEACWNLYQVMFNIDTIFSYLAAGSLETAIVVKKEAFPWIMGALVVVFLAPNTQEIHRKFQPALDFVQTKIGYSTFISNKAAWQPNSLWLWINGALFLAVYIEMSSISEFIYFQF